MDIVSVNCPNCGANVQNKNGKDVFFCEYCGSKIVLNDSNTVRYVDEARLKEVELEREKFRAEQEREKMKREREAAEANEAKKTEDEYKAWKKRTLISVGGAFLLTGLASDAVGSGISILLLAAIIYAVVTNPKRKEQSANKSETNERKSYSEPGVVYKRPELPWYHNGFMIFIFGCFTGGLYWFIGPFLRRNWKKNNW